MTVSEPMTFTGSRGPYQWFVTKHDDLPTLIKSCPEALAGKYIAVTSLDSGPKNLTDEEESLGWRSQNDIASELALPWWKVNSEMIEIYKQLRNPLRQAQITHKVQFQWRHDGSSQRRSVGRSRHS